MTQRLTPRGYHPRPTPVHSAFVSPLGRIREHADGTTVVELDGDADLGALPQLQQLLARAVDAASTVVVVDLDGVTVFDDAALGLIVGAAASARRRGVELRLICTERRRRARLADTRLDRIIHVDDGTAP